MPKEQKATRKLRAILSADVKGYSILMADDEISTIQTLKDYRKTMSTCIERQDGRVVDAVGDNLLAEFGSAVDAVQCAVEVQKKLKEKNQELPEGKRLQFRIGVNIGDVIQDGDRIFGDGVNIAARIEGLADAGGVCISRNAYDHIKKKLKLGYEYLGDHEVKNIKDPVRVYKVLMDPVDAGKLIGVKKRSQVLKWIIATGGILVLLLICILLVVFFKYFNLPAPETIDPDNKMIFELPKGPSVAVMPFDNMTGDKEMEFFCDGITENLISTLSYYPELFVIARNSTFAYKGKHVNVQQIGKELGARYVIEGSIHQSEETIRIIVQLIDAQSGLHKWSETYDRELKDFLELQDEIAVAIAQAMGVNLKSQGTSRLTLNDPQEYKKVLRGWSYFSRQTPESIKQAQVIADELIAMNPKNSSALVLLGYTYIQELWFGGCDSQIICLGKATEAVRKALSLEKTYDLAHMAASNIFLMRKEHDKAIDSAKVAISFNPSNADAYGHLGFVYIYTDELERALDFIKKAIHLNPLPPSYYYFYLGFAYQDSRQYEKAIEAYNKCIEISPNNWGAYVGMVVVYGHMGDKENAIKTISELHRIYPDFSRTHFLNTLPFKKESSRDFVDEGFTKAGLID